MRQKSQVCKFLTQLQQSSYKRGIFKSEDTKYFFVPLSPGNPFEKLLLAAKMKHQANFGARGTQRAVDSGLVLIRRRATASKSSQH